MSGVFTFETLLCVLILFIYTISASIFEKFHFHYLHESGLCMILGVICSLFAKLISPDVIINIFIVNRIIFPIR